MKKVKALFIDWNGTLSSSLFFEQMNNVNHPHHNIIASVEEWLFRKNKKLCSEWMYGKYSTEDVIGLMSKNLNVEYELLLNELKNSCENMKFISDEIPSLIREIKDSGIKVIIATDNMDCFTRWTVPALGLDDLFDDILNSFDLGVVKNDFSNEGKPLFFAKYMDNLDEDYSSTMLLDDSSKTCNLLSLTGMQCVVINSKEKMVAILKQPGENSIK